MSGESTTTPPSTGSRVRRAVRLGWRRRREVLDSVILLPRVSWELRHHGYNAAVRWSNRTRVVHPRPDPDDIEVAREIGFAVRLVARMLPDATCLRQTLVQRRLLLKRGIDSTVCLGTKPGVGAPSFHAWLEVDGTAVSDDPAGLTDFVRLSTTDDRR